jgi:hypothetical protein
MKCLGIICCDKVIETQFTNPALAPSLAGVRIGFNDS